MNYPIVLSPTAHADGAHIIKNSSKGKKIGASELIALSHIYGLGIRDIREDVCVNINGHRYEPDLAYIDKNRGIYIDIEMDEPYTTLHKPVHYLMADGTHRDHKRNELFRAAGWYVVRFTERQLSCETAACMKLIYDILLHNGAINSMPQILQDAPMVTPEECWDANLSVKRSYEYYRKSYLGFSPTHIDLTGIIRCSILITPILIQSIRIKPIRKLLIKNLRHFFKLL